MEEEDIEEVDEEEEEKDVFLGSNSTINSHKLKEYILMQWWIIYYL